MLNYSSGDDDGTKENIAKFMEEHPNGDFMIMGADGMVMVWFDKGFDMEHLAYLLAHISLDIHSMLEERRREAEKN